MADVVARINFEKEGIRRIGDLGVGQLRGRVYATTGIAPSLSSTQWKDPNKVIIWSRDI